MMSNKKGFECLKSLYIWLGNFLDVQLPFPALPSMDLIAILWQFFCLWGVIYVLVITAQLVRRRKARINGSHALQFLV